MTEHDMPSKLLWLDLEMTGLDPVKQRIIEVAAVVTDFDFAILGTYEAVIHQPDEVFENAEEWPKLNLKELFSECRASKISEAEAEAAVSQLVARLCPDEKVFIAGNSIHQDRRFIRQWWHILEEALHYRMFDVSTLKIWVQATKDEAYQKKESHRAMEDILESIEETKWLLKKLQ